MTTYTLRFWCNKNNEILGIELKRAENETRIFIVTWLLVIVAYANLTAKLLLFVSLYRRRNRFFQQFFSLKESSRMNRSRYALNNLLLSRS